MPDDGAAPHATQHDRLLPAIEGHRHDRRVGPGDRQEDRRMVEAAHDRPAAVVSRQAVVHRRNTEHRQRAGDVDDQPHPLAERAPATDGHDHTKHGDDSERHDVRPPREQWLDHQQNPSRRPYPDDYERTNTFVVSTRPPARMVDR